jgi:hypothetical protein
MLICDKLLHHLFPAVEERSIHWTWRYCGYRNASAPNSLEAALVKCSTGAFAPA